MAAPTLDCLLLRPTRTEDRLRALRARWKEHEQISLQTQVVAQLTCIQQTQALADQIDRFDLVLLIPSLDELPWCRTLLAECQPTWARPVMLLTHDLQAAAIHDLLWLGAADFAQLDAPFAEVLLRCRRLHHQRLGQRGCTQLRVSETAIASESNRGWRAGAHSQRDSSDESLNPGPTASSDTQPQVPDFNSAKRACIHTFERRWLIHMLRTHRGNVTHAARASGKDRRAFWALLQRHQLSAAPFRPQ